jgi:acyl-CoA synthetase (AMP-forming)/AMP-acid ligase II
MRLTGPPLPLGRHATLVEALAAAAAHPSGVTFVGLREEETSLSWAEVHARAARVAGALGALGVEAGDRVGIVLRTSPGFLDAFFGAWLAGAVPVPLYPPVRLGRMEEYLEATARMLAISGARVLLSTGAVQRLLGGAVERTWPALGCHDVESLAVSDASPRVHALPPAPAPTALGLVQFSSGSTVDPKPVALTHAALAAQAAALHTAVRPDARDALVSWLPLYHDMGLIGGLLGAMSYPGRLVLIAPEHFLARPALWLRAIARHRGTISMAPSFAYAYCADRVKDADLAGLSLTSWRLALDGAEAVSGDAMRRFAVRFAPSGFDPGALVPVYGLSEAALAVTFGRPGRPLEGRRVDPARLAREGCVAPGKREIMSVGTPVPGFEVEVRGGDGAPAGERRLGRIFARGPSLMEGYLGDPAATERALRDGWLDTGDLGFVAEGELYVHGRAKDVVIVRGANHAPEEFEAALAGIPGLRPGCAVALGVTREDGAEALLVLAERGGARRGEGRGAGDDAALRAAIRAAVLERTGVAPGAVELLAPGTLPRTSSGKLRRQEALRRHLAGTLTPPRSAGVLRLALEAARGQLAWARVRRRPSP